MSAKINIGLFGFGCVGSGFYQIINESNKDLVIKKIAVKNPMKPRKFNCDDIITTNKYDILHDEDIKIIVELIDDATEAFQIVKEAIKLGKPVISANKKMIAENLNELILLQQNYKTPFLYEGAVGGSIPILNLLNGYYKSDKISHIAGILNGTTNYILSKTLQHFKPYNEVLLEAQKLGFAESNPILDVEAYDPKYKLCILLWHVFHIYVHPEKILNIGISNLDTVDLLFAQKNNLKIKLIAQASAVSNKYTAFVFPTFVNSSSNFYYIYNQFNAVEINTDFCGNQLFTGKGAGSIPTAAAVLSDVNLILENTYNKNKLVWNLKETNLTDVEVPIYLRCYNKEIADLIMHRINNIYVGEKYIQVIGYAMLSQIALKKQNLNNCFISYISPMLISQLTNPTHTNKSYQSIH